MQCGYLRRARVHPLSVATYRQEPLRLMLGLQDRRRVQRKRSRLSQRGPDQATVEPQEDTELVAETPEENEKETK